MSRISRRPRAADDIAEIWAYIAEDNLTAADRWIDRLDEQFRRLAGQPMMGRGREALGQGIRSFPFGRSSSSTCRSTTVSTLFECCIRLGTVDSVFDEPGQ